MIKSIFKINSVRSVMLVLSIILTVLAVSTSHASPLFCSQIFTEKISSSENSVTRPIENRFRSFVTWSGLDDYYHRIRLELAALSLPGKLQEHFDILLGHSQDIVERNLGFEVKFSMSDYERTTIIEILNPEGKPISHGQYISLDGVLTLLVFNIETSPAYYKNDLSRLILAKMLALNPRTQRIKTSLAKTNKAIFQAAKQAGDSNLAAFLKTPAYKIRAQLGFSKIKYEQYLSHGNLVVEKDSN